MPRPDGWDDDPASLLGGDIPFRPMSMAEMLDGSIAGIRRDPRFVLGMSVAVSTVIQVVGSVAAYYFIGRGARGEITPDVLLRSVGGQFVLGVLGLVLSAVGILVVAGLLAPLFGRALFGMPAVRRTAWRDARGRLPALAGLALLIVAVPLLGLLIPTAPLIALLAVEGHPALIVLAGIVGVPVGLFLMTWLYVLLVMAVPALVLERLGVGAALRRARALSRGRWWRTAGTLLLTLLITVFMGFFALRVPFMIVELLFFGDADGGWPLVLGLAVDTLGRIVAWSIVIPFDAGVIVLLYLDRRMRREGFDLDLRTRAAAAPAGSGGEPADERETFFARWRTPAGRPS
ncbi:hypothetical protein [Actinomadura macrotermitis]|uniref:Glycerophosphoryl diester phosphodiesterase membrane domain-containing protein n=1 Tax=Actinomadura macrotermitis TaxID=2585200 RepID=A0A7K0C0X2_9ACTN|nr:hypothetical protein [Actinomadura macrotermitis]MQY07111.1 hypothetical protein [Actinomadura macrotermitis]